MAFLTVTFIINVVYHSRRHLLFAGESVSFFAVVGQRYFQYSVLSCWTEVLSCATSATHLITVISSCLLPGGRVLSCDWIYQDASNVRVLILVKTYKRYRDGHQSSKLFWISWLSLDAFVSICRIRSTRNGCLETSKKLSWK